MQLFAIYIKMWYNKPYSAYNNRKGGIKMVNDSYRNRAKSIVSKAKEKGLVKTYADFCKTDVAKKSAVSSEDVSYYTSEKKGEAR